MLKKKPKVKEVEAVPRVRTWFLLEMLSPIEGKTVRGQYKKSQIIRIKNSLKNPENFMVWTRGQKEWVNLKNYKIKADK